MLNLIWKILPGVLLGQWAAMMAYFLPAACVMAPGRWAWPSAALK